MHIFIFICIYTRTHSANPQALLKTKFTTRTLQFVMYCERSLLMYLSVKPVSHSHVELVT